MNRYNHPNSTTTREAYTGVTPAGATTESSRFCSFQKATMRNVAFRVETAGAAGHGYGIYLDGVLKATQVIDAAVAGTVFVKAVEFTVPRMGVVTVRSLTDAVGTADVVYVYTVDHDADQA